MNEAFVTSWWLAVAACLVELAILAPLGLLLSLRLAETEPGSRTRRLVFWMLWTALIGGVSAASSLSFYLVHFEGVDAAVIGILDSRCDWLQRGTACLYGFSMLGLYMVLIVRAEIPLDRENRLHMTLFNVSRLGILTGLPCVSLVGLYLFSGRVDYDTCTFEVSAAIAIAFSAMDFSVSMMLLLLFYIPVRRHIALAKAAGSSAQQVQESKRMHALALRSLRLSLVQVVSTLAAQMFGMVSQALYDDSLEELAYLRVVRHGVYQADLIINFICMMALGGSSWMPRKSLVFTILMESLVDMKDTIASIVTPGKRHASVRPASSTTREGTGSNRARLSNSARGKAGSATRPPKPARKGSAQQPPILMF